jgi:hypothetical protein
MSIELKYIRAGAHPASYPLGNGTPFVRVNLPGYETDRSPPSSAEVKNDGAISPLPHTSSFKLKTILFWLLK